MGEPIPTPEKVEAPVHAAINAFDRAYHEHYGAHPSWSPRNCAMMKQLVDEHGLDEVIRRMTRLFAGVIQWPNPPYNLGIFATQFDRLVLGGKPKPSELLGRTKP